MTEREAQRLLAEHRAECPSFVRGRHLYKVRRDGRVDVFTGNPTTDRWRFEYSTTPEDHALHIDVRRSLAS